MPREYFAGKADPNQQAPFERGIICCTTGSARCRETSAAMTTPSWEHLEHGADIGVRGHGASLAEAFAQAALALSGIVTELDKIDAVEAIDVECEAPEFDLLLVDWLNEIVYQMATRNMLFGRFEVRIGDHRLLARLYGETVDPARHQPAVEIKGATFTELRVYQTDAGDWIAQCVVDV
jgi:tRNA nucleotidyltransferase (CCA-adding enzyme)